MMILSTEHDKPMSALGIIWPYTAFSFMSTPSKGIIDCYSKQICQFNQIILFRDQHATLVYG